MEIPKELQKRYIMRRVHDLDNCLRSLSKKEYTEIEKVGHQIKGTGTTYGHEGLAHIASELEAAASEKNAEKIRKILKEFSIWLNRKIN